ncbi:hypothetical protein AUEXF2481DRAFT_2620 [Aureobasidium subglaciale EXF-2481]|uniref:Uncharacterized protein n=1 Tax=Aureobasidium subglaciale (strain EXF-2481) TaxID=1043005 RepID=A0A074YUA2_AURSE|nr:uncharacterized protein AUEXF2481DRAFT_2620 [Aureobasidium subglaciale EXF-2481]KEQ97687.1 hypothetical protein AUEXF2481DRAFT_2620 [Aureobasidium subglaciale EXF-2481]
MPPLLIQSQSRSAIPSRQSNASPKANVPEVPESDFVMKVFQGQQAIMDSQAGIAELQGKNLEMQLNNYHTVLEVTDKMQHTISHMQQIQEDVQVSDKIAFAAGFGCGLLVCLAIWISPLSGKEKDEDADK